MTTPEPPTIAAEALLMRLKAHGIDYLFANGGTDFAPIIEAYITGGAKGSAMPQPVIIPHETAAVAMAHGYYLATGRPQAVMVYVNVGLANCIMGLINAASENIPMVVLAGRTPVTEHQRLGSRMTPIQYGQEMRDQSAMIRELVKWDYELRYGEQVEHLIDRAYTIAMSEPRGPVFLALPREPLAETMAEHWAAGRPRQVTPTAPQPDIQAIREAAALLAKAKTPLVICQRGDPEGNTGRVLAKLATDFGLPIFESWANRNVLPTAHPMHCGFNYTPSLPEADVILVIDAQVPWIQRHHQPGPGAKVIHIGADPLFSRFPVHSFQIDLAITSVPAPAIEALGAEMAKLAPDTQRRYASIAARNQQRRADAKHKALAGNGSPMTPAFVSRCLAEALDKDAMHVSELGADAEHLDLETPNCFFTPAFSGGLGWGFPAALGAKLADRKRQVVATVGDGCYMFANPVACHQVAEAMNLPILLVVMNNGIWNAVRRAALAVYPTGAASKLPVLPITSLAPSPDFAKIAEASRGWAENVEKGADLPGAIQRALNVIKTEKRQALLNVNVSY
jgi:acetolactate synthase I/II/III large subunit